MTKTMLKALMNALILIGFATAASLALSGCQPATESKPAADTQALELVREAEKLQEGVRLGQRLNSLTVRDRDALSVLLNDIKVGLLRVAENNRDVEALRILKRGLVEWGKSSIQLQRTDEGVFTAFLTKVHFLLNERARAAGVDVDELTWSLYANDFATGVEPFSSISNGAQWEADWALDEPLVRVSGYDVKAWLISPTFDLTQVRDPSFRIEHLFMINRNTGKFATDVFDRKRIVTEAFKVMVSQNYESGDPAAATWEQVDISPLPSSYNFHAVQSPLVSLEKFRGDKVAVAFVFDMPASQLGHHYVTWQINRFELFGAGPTPSMAPRPRALWNHSFSARDFKPFQAATYGEPNAPQWTPFATSPGATPKFAKVGASGIPFEAWLVSPLLKLTGEELALGFKEVVRNAGFNQLRVLISEEYRGGDPRESTWTELTRPKMPEIKPDTWQDVRSGPIDLSAYQGRTVAIAFQFNDAGGPGDRVWEIENLVITGKSPQDLKVTEKDYGMTKGQAPAAESLQSYAFTQTVLDPFVAYASPSSATTWAPVAMKGVIKYAKAGSGTAPADTWLLSPRITMTGQNLAVTIKHTVRNPDWATWKLMISTDYTGGDPQFANWTELAIAPAAPVPADKWTDLVAADLDLAKFAGQAFVLAFRYQDVGGPGARVWEIETLDFTGRGKFSATGPLDPKAASSSTQPSEPAPTPVETTPNRPGPTVPGPVGG